MEKYQWKLERTVNATARKSWIPKDRVRVCWGCWRFFKYGPNSRYHWTQQLTNKACAFGLWSGKVHKWLDNWEIRTWLGETVKLKDGTVVSARDMRLRCLICTVKDSLIKLLMRNSEVRRREQESRIEELTEILEGTRPKR
jgi:hypothetical protein